MAHRGHPIADDAEGRVLTGPGGAAGIENVAVWDRYMFHQLPDRLAADRKAIAEIVAGHDAIPHGDARYVGAFPWRLDRDAIVGAPEEAALDENVPGVDRIDTVAAGDETQGFDIPIRDVVAVLQRVLPPPAAPHDNALHNHMGRPFQAHHGTAQFAAVQDAVSEDPDTERRRWPRPEGWKRHGETNRARPGSIPS